MLHPWSMRHFLLRVSVAQSMRNSAGHRPYKRERKSTSASAAIASSAAPMIIAMLVPLMDLDLGLSGAAGGVATGFTFAGEVGASLTAAVSMRVLLLGAAGGLRGGGGAGGAAERVAATDVMSSSPAGGVSNLPVGSYSTPRSCQRICDGV
jgi:hypothetical protein